MKKVFSIILTLTLLLNSFVISCFASTEEYKTINAEFSDKKDAVESLDVMVIESNVYIEAHQLGERLGYDVKLTNNENGVVIFADGKGNIPRTLAVFYFNSNEVEYLVLNSIEKYEAPFNAIKNDKGIWIPFKYAILALNSSMLIINDVVTITMPQNTLLNTMLCVSQDMNNIQFDYHSDMLFSDGDMALETATSRLVNLFSGILEFEGESWLLMFQQFWGDTSAYDNKFADELATLFCTNSDKELEALNKQIDLLTDVFSTDGKLGTALSEINTSINTTVDDLYDECNKLFRAIDESNADVSKYNATYEQFEKAFNKQTTFTKTGQVAMDVQGGLDSVTKKFSVIGEVLEVTGYMSEYSEKDDYSVQAIIEYINSFKDSTLLPETFLTSLKSIADILNSNIAEYSVYRYIENNYTDWIQSGLQIGQQMGAQANIALLAWNIASATIPFIKNGLDSADNFELSMYAYALQQDAFINYVDFRQEIFSNNDLLTDENLFKLAQYLYTYLKSAYITRDAAVGSFANHKDKPDSQDVLEMWAAPNEIVAQYLAQAKMVTEENKDGTIGFTPDRSKWIVDNYTDEDLLKILEYTSNDSEKDDLLSTDEQFYKYIKDNLTISSSFPYDVQKSNGVFSALIEDFDSDGQKEMITFSITHNEASQAYVIIDLYILKNNIVTLVDTSSEIAAFAAGNFQSQICCTLENSLIKIDASACGYGGSYIWSKYMTFKVVGDKLTLCDEYSLYEFYRNDMYEYEETVSGKTFSSYEDFYSAVEKSGYDTKTHNHVGYEDAEFDVNNDDHTTAQCFKGNHIFTLFDNQFMITTERYGFIHDNTNLADYISGGKNSVENNALITSEWKKSYIDFINSNEKGISSTLGFDSYQYYLINIDNDNIPELYIDYISYAGGAIVYSYQNGSIVKQHVKAGVSYIEGEGLFLNSYYIIGCDNYYDEVYLLKDGSFSMVSSGYLQIYYSPEYKEEYVWDGKTVSKEEYDSTLSNYFEESEAKSTLDLEAYDCNEIVNAINNY